MHLHLANSWHHFHCSKRLLLVVLPLVHTSLQEENTSCMYLTSFCRYWLVCSVQTRDCTCGRDFRRCQSQWRASVQRVSRRVYRRRPNHRYVHACIWGWPHVPVLQCLCPGAAAVAVWAWSELHRVVVDVVIGATDNGVCGLCLRRAEPSRKQREHVG